MLFVFCFCGVIEFVMIVYGINFVFEVLWVGRVYVICIGVVVFLKMVEICCLVEVVGMLMVWVFVEVFDCCIGGVVY